MTYWVRLSELKIEIGTVKISGLRQPVFHSWKYWEVESHPIIYTRLWLYDFNHTARSYKDLRDNPEFSDVTLVCEEQQFETHQIVLTNSNILFHYCYKKYHTPTPQFIWEG